MSRNYLGIPCQPQFLLASIMLNNNTPLTEGCYSIAFIFSAYKGFGFFSYYNICPKILSEKDDNLTLFHPKTTPSSTPPTFMQHALLYFTVHTAISLQISHIYLLLLPYIILPPSTFQIPPNFPLLPTISSPSNTPHSPPPPPHPTPPQSVAQ